MPCNNNNMFQTKVMKKDQSHILGPLHSTLKYSIFLVVKPMRAETQNCYAYAIHVS
jgi:hypothetical protein